MIELISYKGERYPIRISYYVLMMAQKESGVSLQELDKNLEFQQSILWFALVAGHKMADKELKLSKEDMVWVLDESYIEFQKALYLFSLSIVEMQEDIMQTNKKK